ncbi:hypothetical protein BJ138DRAFT_1171205 [Hygrophoropsis aurantiaca]|uniref:Uncharacterized protein n=1 Tax=Hygrophoropsis aurantiaca TaxID=72124 RepID=A0ACB8AJ80_9AGAM|nr:hypothetical protein BJ138DRAFT_1171205 [Hygrophoropsis aurantiaca]
MSSSSTIRLAKGVCTAARPTLTRSKTSSLAFSRAYATPATEKDPQLGDYPDLPWVSNQHLAPRGWWDQQMRRNFEDPIPENEEVLSMWGPDVPGIPPQKALFQFTLAVTGFVGFGLLCNYALVPERPAVPREYPFSGLVRELGGLEENRAREESVDVED